MASPYLNDPNFLRTVVYILHHDEQGAFGLVLNRPLNLSVGDMLQELVGCSFQISDPVCYGGPVDGLIMLMQVAKADSGSESSVMVASDRDRISEIFNQDGMSECLFRLFDGYSGWGPKQLESELKGGSWLLWDISPDQLFSNPDEMWEMAVREIGRDIIASGIAATRLPQDPSNN